jgi:hypothetical protein
VLVVLVSTLTGILGLLARLLAAALLLTGLLTRVLVLLAGVLVLIAHSLLPLLSLSSGQRTVGTAVARGTPVPARSLQGNEVSTL